MSAEPLIETRLDRFQSQAFRAVQPGRTVVMALGRGSGKTYLLALLIHVLALQYPGSKIGLIMPSLKQARAVFWTPHLLPAYLGPLKGAISHRPNMSDLTADYVNGSRLSTWGTENASGIRGQRFDILFSDETDDISPETESSIVEPTLSRSGSRAMVIKAGTYTRGRYGILHRDMQLARSGEPGYFGLTVTSEQSPQVDQQWLARVKRRINPRTFDREYLCNPDSGEGLVFPHFHEVPTECGFSHIIPPIVDHVTWSDVIVGVDWGFEHPGVFLVIGVSGSGRDAVCYVLDEVYASGYTKSWWKDRAKEIRARYPYAKWYADPSRPDEILEFKRDCAINIIGADNSVKEGIDVVADKLATVDYGEDGKRAHLYVCGNCQNTIREFGLYRRRKDPRASKSGEIVFSDEVDKVNDDAIDSLRYALATYFGRTPSYRIDRSATDYQDG